MSFPAYPAYRDSGIGWLGAIPTAWNTARLKRDLRFLTSGSRGWATHYSDDGATFIRIGNLTRDGLRIDLSDLQRVAVPSGTEGERTRVATDDLLFSITAFMGSIAVVPDGMEEAYVSQHVALARLRKNLFCPDGLVTPRCRHQGRRTWMLKVTGERRFSSVWTMLQIFRSPFLH